MYVITIPRHYNRVLREIKAALEHQSRQNTAGTVNFPVYPTVKNAVIYRKEIYSHLLIPEDWIQLTPE
jgi:hypothetical protein